MPLRRCQSRLNDKEDKCQAEAAAQQALHVARRAAEGADTHAPGNRSTFTSRGGQGMQLQMNQTDVCIRCLVKNSLSFRLKHRICAIRRAPPLHSCARRAGLIAACCRLRALLRPHKLEHHAAVAAVGWPVAHLRHKEGCELFRSHEPGLAGNAGVPL